MNLIMICYGYVYINLDTFEKWPFRPLYFALSVHTEMAFLLSGNGAFSKTLSHVDRLEDGVFVLQCGRTKRTYSKTAMYF